MSDAALPSLPPKSLLEVEDLDVRYGGRGLAGLWTRKPGVAAVRGVTFHVRRSETFALVGESGSGKSTIARAVAGLVPVSGGGIRFDGEDAALPVRRRERALTRRIQIVFQNPDSSLNPRHRVRTILGRPLALFRSRQGHPVGREIGDLLRDVRLDPSYAGRRPAQLSGGERQRVALARALAADPDLLLCDEILSALDVSVQAGILELLGAIQRERALAYLFISHDLAVVRWFAHAVAVLYRGRICEIGPTEALFAPPYHPYTEMLLDAVPKIGGRLRAAAPQAQPAAGVGSATINAGCPFSLRCPRKLGAICDRELPPAQILSSGHVLHCHIPAARLRQLQHDLTKAGDAVRIGQPARPG